jgi:hypothetical protein
MRKPEPATNVHEAAGPLASLRERLHGAWTRETSVQPDDWTARTPSVGQCAVTALVVQDLLGGDLLRAVVDGGSHYWNRLPNGEELDLTRDQFSSFPDDIKGEVRSREYVLSNENTRDRYLTLKERVWPTSRVVNG